MCHQGPSEGQPQEQHLLRDVDLHRGINRIHDTICVRIVLMLRSTLDLFPDCIKLLGCLFGNFQKPKRAKHATCFHCAPNLYLDVFRSLPM